MAELFGKHISRSDLLRRIGNIAQAGGTRLVELKDGKERGVRAIEFDTGTGFRFTVLADRAMDVFSASYCGRSLCWHSVAGAAAPHYFDPRGLGWLWTFPGGLVTTCGLVQAGGACTDEGEELGLHGRVSGIPASNVSHGTRWEGDDCILFAQGTVVEGRIFGWKQQLIRRITAKLGESRFFIRDVVENIGYEPCPHMIVYHCNIGYPVLDAGSRLVAPTQAVKPLNKATEADMEYSPFSGPTPGYSERVYDHAMKPDGNGMVRAALVNDALDGGRGLGVYLQYCHSQLPRFTQWKMLGEGTYVVGMEPGNCSVLGRGAARKAGELVILQPQEAREYELEVGVEGR